jgi:hypothetical protein
VYTIGRDDRLAKEAAQEVPALGRLSALRWNLPGHADWAEALLDPLRDASSDFSMEEEEAGGDEGGSHAGSLMPYLDALWQRSGAVSSGRID